MWPPTGIVPIAALGLPLLNTVLLVSSGAALTASHNALLMSNALSAALYLLLTLALALAFAAIQAIEYASAAFTISDGIYGSAFYCSTGLHGLHVVAGAIFLAFALLRINASGFTTQRHAHLECAAWYWHVCCFFSDFKVSAALYFCSCCFQQSFAVISMLLLATN